MADVQFPAAELINLPWNAQLTLAGGYASYLVCYSGIRAWHTAVDTVFSTLIFGLVVAGVHVGLTRHGCNEAISSLLAIAAGCGFAAVWRLFGRPFMRSLLRFTNVSWIDDDPSALASVITNSKYRMTQISVQLDDESWLRCDDLHAFENAPFGPCKIGPNGDVSLYLTHVETKDGDAKAIEMVRHEYYGDRLTYVPASKIRRINFRHVK